MIGENLPQNLDNSWHKGPRTRPLLLVRLKTPQLRLLVKKFLHQTNDSFEQILFCYHNWIAYVATFQEEAARAPHQSARHRKRTAANAHFIGKKKAEVLRSLTTIEKILHTMAALGLRDIVRLLLHDAAQVLVGVSDSMNGPGPVFTHDSIRAFLDNFDTHFLYHRVGHVHIHCCGFREKPVPLSWRYHEAMDRQSLRRCCR